VGRVDPIHSTKARGATLIKRLTACVKTPVDDIRCDPSRLNAAFATCASSTIATPFGRYRKLLRLRLVATIGRHEMFFACREQPSGSRRAANLASRVSRVMSALPPKVDIRQRDLDVRFVPEAEVIPHPASSTRTSSAGSTSSRIVLAAYRLNTSSNLVDCRIGRSTGLAPFRTRPTALLLTV